MFDPTTPRGRLAAAAVAALVLTMVACNMNAPDPDPAVEDDGGATDTTGTTGATDTTDTTDADDSGGDGTEAPADGEAGAALTSASAVTCHERNDAGGNSDVVFTLAIDGVEAGTTGTVTYDGPAGSAQADLEVGADGMATVLLPATNYGDVFTITAVTVAGTDLDTAAVGSSLSHTVPDDTGSDCATHPNA